MVNIADFNIYRRDRNWSGLDMRNKGGVAVYVKKNLCVVDVYLSRLNLHNSLSSYRAQISCVRNLSPAQTQLCRERSNELSY